MPAVVNRTEELTRLHDLYDSDDVELAVVYGRRRLGKTALVRELLQADDDAVNGVVLRWLTADDCSRFRVYKKIYY